MIFAQRRFALLLASAFVVVAGCGGDGSTAGGGSGGGTAGSPASSGSHAGGATQSGGGTNLGGFGPGGSGMGGVANGGGGSGATGGGGTGGVGTAGGGTGGAANGGGPASSSAASTAASSTAASTGSGGGGPTGIQTVFLIMMENHDWSDIHGSNSAPYINNTLLPIAAHAEHYKTPPGIHPSEPNYIWLEAGDNLGITDDGDPSANHQSTTNHLTTRLEAANITWKAYAEGISGNNCPQSDTGLFAVRHTPQLYFDDVTSNAANCKAHVRPYSELASNLSAGTVARYNFITPNICNDMHGQSFGTTCFSLTTDLIKLGDNWLASEIPMIMASPAYQNGGAIFILWDEGGGGLGGSSDGPIPLLVLSSQAKAGYAGNVAYTHSSMLRSLQEIFGISPFMRDAANAQDLSDLFTSFP